MATLDEWLDHRRAAVPDTLWEKIGVCVQPHVNAETPALAQLTAASAEQMGRMRERACTSRADALDLLTTDALVTYTLELAASEQPTDLDEIAAHLLLAIAGEVALPPTVV